VGQAVLGFGFVFLGMRLMTEAMTPVTESGLARQVLVALSANAGLGLLLGAVFSAGMSSSAATIGLVLSLASQGLLPLSGAIPVVLGANIGTCATALTASLRSSADARRVAVAHIAFKVLGVALVFPFIHPLASLVGVTASDPARQIANTHTLFNVAISAVFLPFAPWAARVITAMVPDDVTTADNPFKTPTSPAWPWGRRRARRSGWVTCPRACCGTPCSSSEATTRSFWRTSSGATISSTTSSGRSSSSSRVSVRRPCPRT